MRWSPGTSKIRTLVLGGANEVLLKLKAPFRKTLDGMWGLNLAGERRLRVSIACWTRQHHKCKEKIGSCLDKPSIKWCLNVWIDRLEIRERCRPGGTSWCWDPSKQIKFSCPLIIHCTECVGAAGDRGLSRACRGPYVLEGAWNLHGISMDPIGLSYHYSCRGPYCICSPIWMLRGTGLFG